ncbi:hypothetical protein HPB48_007673 [Haemaphysalis longicornis]|uniref:Uncharacterized protein n=1 Tax=Haemaphysalis longicornis TaxID=44386 RepID=A0A9J6G2L6_HAELO|nr:hypothetical protein HPB48_007673 [Haemaphysalis longicornis]
MRRRTDPLCLHALPPRFLHLCAAGPAELLGKWRPLPAAAHRYLACGPLGSQVTLFPTLLLNTSGRADVPLGIRDFAGWALWLLGFTMELIADHQKAAFHADAKNKVSSLLLHATDEPPRGATGGTCFQANYTKS